MPKLLPPSIEKAIEAFEALPGIGPKTAQRLVFHLLRSDRMKTQKLADACKALFEGVQVCQRCGMLAEITLCTICSDMQRQQDILCVVAEPFDVIALENMGQYKGTYHVLGGELSPLDGIGPEQLTIDLLFERIQQETPLQEIILATNPTLEGEATAMYIAKLLGTTSIRVTRIARGVPIGGDLEYANSMTLGNAIQGRTEFTAH